MPGKAILNQGTPKIRNNATKPLTLRRPAEIYDQAKFFG